MKIDEILGNVLEGKNSAFFYTPSIYKDSKSYYFTSPVEIIETRLSGEVPARLKMIEKALQKGLTGYGCLSYELGYLFEERLKHLCSPGTPLIKFCFFKKKDVIKLRSKDIQFTQWDENKFNISGFKLNVDKERYIADIEKIKNCIAEGDTYQVNYTANGAFNFSGNASDLFKKLVFNQSSRYSAFINSGEELLLSLSPELFFKIKNEKIIAAPMKGTMPRGINHEDDSSRKKDLHKSRKDIAENLMIVDLLRNDLGRISRYGSVSVNNMFEIEKYETLFQQVSYVESTLRKKVSFGDVIKNIFPCGSITGAPKIRTMEIIHELEQRERGIYTGAIGLIQNKKAVFNVAIRTIKIQKSTGAGEIGLGSGIVWDSSPEKEYDETLLKSNFLLKPTPYFEIIETMLVKNGKIFLLDEHLERLKNTAKYFLFRFDRNKITKTLSSEVKKLDREKKYRLRLSLDKWGKMECILKEEDPYAGPVHIAISDKNISSRNKFQYFKTTDRPLYDTELAQAREKGLFDILFLNENSELCEGCITNIFIRKGNLWYTPPVSSGILSGVFRNYWMKKNPAIREKVLFKEDLLNADEILLTNSVKGIIKVDEHFFNTSE